MPNNKEKQELLNLTFFSLILYQWLFNNMLIIK